ncbi:zinc finger CCCH domain-containing protein 14-like [Hibiscus syriacus]|uniref:zinc finger CCCH domain-containing protein 14-like n=1 Tax=Hibiscus syriacus TaxID=106335 RepID=UPI001920674A|nr:zinc finger CCCH domain-containing protein 14-like [Hibiscus syriacus]
MEKPTPPSSNLNATSVTVENRNYVSVASPPRYYHDQDLTTTDFSSIYNFIFLPSSTLSQSLSVTPSSCSSSDNLKHSSYNAATEHRLNHARLILEYQQLSDHFDIFFSRLQVLMGELETLRKENRDLRLANTKLIRLLSLSSQTTAVSNRNNQCEKLPDLNDKIWERGRKKSVPKTVSFESPKYHRVNQQQRVATPMQRIRVASFERREEKGNQGMVKTELCNKWQERGSCPYGDHCQFSHGIAELRPVIRHPRYKTQVCRVVLAGEACPYGHRCHFRHSLTEQEQLLLSP